MGSTKSNKAVKKQKKSEKKDLDTEVLQNSSILIKQEKKDKESDLFTDGDSDNDSNSEVEGQRKEKNFNGKNTKKDVLDFVEDNTKIKKGKKEKERKEADPQASVNNSKDVDLNKIKINKRYAAKFEQMKKNQEYNKPNYNKWATYSKDDDR